ncbi:hypothetical protein BB561_004429 [Smittium simulii]|uniref:Rab-GAP TBC domain-containing protein n=1 Tax=Smittium simulii TaxID=133385 RepID=A0A2T9YG80_9FUNG|nr:hypothetical protein BB561_004429 [Smittium simulii]
MSSASNASVIEASNQPIKSSLELDALSQKISFEFSPRATSSDSFSKKHQKPNIKRISIATSDKDLHVKSKPYRNSPLSSDARKGSSSSIALSINPSSIKIQNNKQPEVGAIRLKRIGSQENSSYRSSISAFNLLLQSESTQTSPIKDDILQTNQKPNGPMQKPSNSLDDPFDPNYKATSEPYQDKYSDSNPEKMSNYLYSAVSSLWAKPTSNPTDSLSYINDDYHRPVSVFSFKKDNNSMHSFDADSTFNSGSRNGSTNDPSIALLMSQIELQNNANLNDPKSSDFAKIELKKQLDDSRIVMRKSGTEDTVDWEYWGALISDFENFVKTNPNSLIKNVYNGVPQEIRGTVWQLLSGSRKDPTLVHKYINMLDKPSSYDKAIIRDLNRTFPEHPYFKEQGGSGQTALYNVLNVYSQHDTELGYCQGLAFVVGPLLLNIPEEDVFCVLDRLMIVYNLRGHYLPNMELLQCRLYQFDKLFEEQYPALFKHFNNEGIRSTMYVSKWFMTLFAYCLPMDLVFRVFDLIFTEGVGVLFQISLAVLKRSQAMLFSLNFEQLIKSLSGDYLFRYYSERGSEAFIHDISLIKAVTPKKMEKLAKEHAYILAKTARKTSDLSALRDQNDTITKEKNHILNTMQSLSKEHSELTSKYVQTRLELNMSADNNAKLNLKVADLEARLLTERQAAEESLKADMDKLTKDNLQLVHRCNDLDDKLTEVEQALVKVNTMYMNSESDRFELEHKLNELRKTLR